MKSIFSIIIIVLIMLVAFQVYALVRPVTDTPGAALSSNAIQTDPVRPESKSHRRQTVKLKKVIQKITRRNLFKVSVDGEKKKKTAPQNLNLEKTSLKLTLWGTVTGQQEQDGWAVIEDLKKKKQDLYRVNDKIQSAVIKSILRNTVILTVNGKDQILEVNADPLPAKHSKPRSAAQKPKKMKRTAPRPPKKKPDMVSQSNQLYKTRPYLKNGEASGVMIYSINKDSVVRRLGLLNGDIIKAVDDDEILNPKDLEDFDDSIDEDSNVTITILRRGKPKELVFNGQDNVSSIFDAEL